MNRKEIERLVNEREIGRNTAGRALRGGDQLDVRLLPCSKTILKLYRKYRLGQGDPDAIVPRYHASFRAVTQADPLAEELLDDCVRGYAHPDWPSKATGVADTTRRFLEENARREAEGLRPLRIYSRRTIDRRIDRLDPFMVACHLHGVDAARKAFATYGDGMPKSFPMQRIEIDEWTVEVITFFGQLGITKRLPERLRRALPKGRRTICVAIDTATRCVVGLVLCANPSATEAIRLLRMIVQDRSEIAKEIGATSDWTFHGGLGVVATDTGSAFQSDEFQTAVHALHERMEFGPVRVPEMRGTMERLFGTLEGSLMPRLSGRTFSNPVEKGDYDAEARAVLDNDDLLRILLMWVIDFYHNTPHWGPAGPDPGRALAGTGDRALCHRATRQAQPAGGARCRDDSRRLVPGGASLRQPLLLPRAARLLPCAQEPSDQRACRPRRYRRSLGQDQDGLVSGPLCRRGTRRGNARCVARATVTRRN